MLSKNTNPAYRIEFEVTDLNGRWFEPIVRHQGLFIDKEPLDKKTLPVQISDTWHRSFWSRKAESWN